MERDCRCLVTLIVVVFALLCRLSTGISETKDSGLSRRRGAPPARDGPPTQGQVVQDGQNLNAACGYEESDNFALLGGDPFYFYSKDGEPGIFVSTLRTTPG